MQSQSYYTVLGVRPGASGAEIRAAYRRLAMKWHPDKITSGRMDPALAEEAKGRFQQIHEAYQVLSDEKRRALYDAGMYDLLDDDQEEDEGFQDFLQEMISLMATVGRELSGEQLEQPVSSDTLDFSNDSKGSHVSLDSASDDAVAVVVEDDDSNRRVKRNKGIKVSPTKKSRGKHSDYWKLFKVVNVPSKKEKGVTKTKAKCRFCYGLFSYKHGGATSHLKRHIPKCAPYLNKVGMQKAQGTLNYDPEGSNLPFVTRTDHEETRRLIAKMIIVHEYPFKMVEHIWFNVLMRYMNASYQFIGRKTIRAECIKVYQIEKENLRKSLKAVDNKNLTCDLWISNQNLCYMSLVAHYIDSNWAMQCRVLNFVELDTPHTGIVIAQVVFECITTWKIEDKIMTITLDNAASNDVVARSLIAKFIARGLENFVPTYFHVRCCSHIANLVVNDGMAPLETLISKLRESVKYMKKSLSRMYKFLEICKSIALEVGEGLKLDVSTRWSSTYRMLSTCIAYKDALMCYADSDANYKCQPSNEEWALYKQNSTNIEGIG